MNRKANKICFIIFSVSNAGGSERIACGLANELARRNYDISIINIYRGSTSFFPLDASIAVQSAFAKPKDPSKYLFPLVPFKVFHIIRKMKQKPDVLLCVGTDQAVYASLSVLLFKIKLVSWEHFNYTINTDVFVTKLGRKITSQFAQALVVLTHTDKQLFEEDKSMKSSVYCIPNFMTFTVSSSSKIDSCTAIAMGRYTYQKGFDTLIEIWKQVSVKHANWTLQIIGEGEEKATLLNKIKEKELQDCIELIPLSSNVSFYYQNASVFLMSSRWEGLPMVLIEAKSFGLPVVSFNCNTGPRDIIKNDIDGLLIPDQDVDAFADELNTLLSDRQRLKTMGSKALQNSEEYKAWKILPQWEELFERIFSSSETRKFKP